MATEDHEDEKAPRSAPASAPAKHGEHAKAAAGDVVGGGFHSHRGRYLKVFYALIVLTLLELGVVYAGLSRSTVIAMLILLALTKAGAVAMFFMHLFDERRALRLMVGLPLLFPPFYAVVLIIEAFARAAFAALKLG
jgi:caa(3)-type oxidase subunit IV